MDRVVDPGRLESGFRVGIFSRRNIMVSVYFEDYDFCIFSQTMVCTVKVTVM
jgi:hypothetical protein